jgi:hypothetical protein
MYVLCARVAPDYYVHFIHISHYHAMTLALFVSLCGMKGCLPLFPWTGPLFLIPFFPGKDHRRWIEAGRLCTSYFRGLLVYVNSPLCSVQCTPFDTLPSPKKNFSNPCYQVGFCTNLISTGASHAIQLGFAPIVYPPGQYK